MNAKPRFFIFILLLLSMFACVPHTQYSEMKSDYEDCKSRRDSLKQENEQLNVKNTELQAKLNANKKDLKDVRQDSTLLYDSLKDMQQEYQDLQNQYDNLKESQESLLKGSKRETKKLLNELQNTQEDLQQREDKLKTMKREVEQKRTNLEQLRKRMEKQKSRLVKLENMVSRKDSLVQQIKDRVSQALLGFEGQGLTISRKKGKVYISMQEKLLFGTGSTEIGDDGIQALQKLGAVLEKNPDIEVMIEGHTDAQPYVQSKGCIDNNWELSVLRAVSVIQTILKHADIDGERLTAAGRSKYLPVADADTPEARRRNRRTEIILTPDLSELFEILNTNESKK